MSAKTATRAAYAAEKYGNDKAFELSQQAYNENMALQQPFINAGNLAFGLKGSLNLDDAALQNRFQQQQSANYQQAINAGVNNAGNLTPQQQQALQSQLGLGLSQYGDYNTLYQQEMGNRRQAYGDTNAITNNLQNMGLAGITSGVGLGGGLTGEWAKNAMLNQDALVGSQLALQEARAKEQSGKYALYGTALGAIGNGAYAYSKYNNPNPYGALDSTQIQTQTPDFLGQ